MFAEVTTFSISPGAMDQLIRAFQDSIKDRSASKPGFVGMLLLTDRSAGQAIALMLWESEVAMLAQGGDYTQQPRSITALLEAPPSSARYEISVRVDCTKQGILWMHGI